MLLLHLVADVGDVALRDHVAAVDEHHLIRDQVDLVQDVAGDDDVQAAVRQLAEEVDDLRTGR
jgi:hypothetical protein